MNIYCVINQKGGVSKSTTAELLMAGLTNRGYKVLGIDMDAQSNMTLALGMSESRELNILQILCGQCEIKDAIQKTKYGDLIVASETMVGADAVLTDMGKEFLLKDALEELDGDYDYIVIDTPPALSIMTTNALIASNVVIIPALADMFSLSGIDKLSRSISMVKKHSNKELRIGGILLTRYNSRTVLGREVLEIVKKKADLLGTKVYKTTIREGIAVRESQINQMSLYEYAPDAGVTKDYEMFIGEILEDEKNA